MKLWNHASRNRDGIPIGTGTGTEQHEQASLTRLSFRGREGFDLEKSVSVSS